MIENKERLIIYLNSVVDSVFKILPLFEEENVGIGVYVESLLFELYQLDKVVDIKHSHEYISLLLTLESIGNELLKDSGRHKVIKREIFKCINIIKNIISKVENGE